jgi:hypothetical protein
VPDAITLPSYEQVSAKDDAGKRAFVEATRNIHINTNPYNAKTLIQFHDRQAVVVTPPTTRYRRMDCRVRRRAKQIAYSWYILGEENCDRSRSCTINPRTDLLQYQIPCCVHAEIRIGSLSGGVVFLDLQRCEERFGHGR